MAKERFYYGSTIEEFVSLSNDEIIGRLAMASPHNDNPETKASWLEEIETLKSPLSNYCGRGSIFMEYNIPRMGRRADVVLLIEGIIFVLEFKTLGSKFSYQASSQVWDYAIDLKNFQLKTFDRTIIPVVVVPGERDRNCDLELVASEDGVYNPTQVNDNKLSELISDTLSAIAPYVGTDNDMQWARGGYEPTPTIIEAAVALYSGHSVEDITKHDGDLEATMTEIEHIIETCRAKKEKAICFVTGVP
ncbi:MAG: hypothetical protein HDP28_00255, partial [Clostridia bacterium]|nr:hypothetical protein [Clostridia bacterium]